MASLVSGFEYDIFISYRHNDNLPGRQAGHSGWVTEFVEALQLELAATIKEPVSIYFDKNPHDGLLDTHSVDKSLEGKLKCLIFIPIISQTYCDPKSFAWQHEFCAFNKFAKEDKFGRDIKLSNGNVSSRILPVKIHDLDAEDLSTVENELGSVLRPIEFIYRSAGVNRPLSPSDNPDKNLSKTYYQDQINKVANGVKELLMGLKYLEDPSRVAAGKSKGQSSKPIAKVDYGKKVRITSITILILFVAAYLLYNVAKMINLPEEAQMPLHRFIFPLAILAFTIIVWRQPIRKVGFLLMQLSAVSVFAGGFAGMLFTFISTSVPRQHVEFLHLAQQSISDDLVQLDFSLLRTLGTARMATAIGGWLILQSLGRQRNKAMLAGFVVMITLAETNDGIQLYTLGMPFYIYSITTVLATWAGAILWWNSDPPASSLSQEMD